MNDFATRIVTWAQAHGRHDLPWQRSPTPYRVWLSEIMLQQTQVQTVIPYFERFTASFPDVAALAAAELDEVLHLWSGLGYYSRARNLHAAARHVVSEHDGVFPATLEALVTLPGIGRSTAAAILALAHDIPAAILDGNVKRVLARYHAESGWPGKTAALDRLWAHAEDHLPPQHARAYTQALMDLGATLCTRTRPDCPRCPLESDCAARRSSMPTAYPGKRPRRTLPERRTCFLIISNDAGHVLLERRPPHGIWGGLWCFPEIDDATQLAARLEAFGLSREMEPVALATISHTFTHFRLTIEPIALRARQLDAAVQEQDDRLWYSSGDSTRIGLSAPVTRLLATVET
ncbi:MAG: A/G-specific adenine glycosylase [Gammaproteobacteria bacterium]